MPDDAVVVERVRFEEHADGVERLLAAYHDALADRFRAFLAERSLDVAFAPGAYFEGELERDLARLRSADPPLVVARDGDRLVGCVYCYDRAPDEGEVKRLFVREPYRGRGVGRRLVERLVACARREGDAVLRLNFAPFMRRARRLYESVGFEPTDGGEPVSEVPEPLLDEITYMRLRLDDE